MSAETTKLPDLSSWTTELLRLTAFHQLGPQSDDRNWWETAVGAQPESKSVKPREGGYEVTGPLAGGVLTLGANPARFDWLYKPDVSLDKLPSGLPTIGPTPESLRTFVPPIEAWLSDAPDIYRLAFGAVLLLPVTDHPTGYQLLSRYLHSVKIDWEHSSELQYAINRPRTLDFGGGVIFNRISKWGLLRFQEMTISVTQGRGEAVPGATHFSLRLELDLSTDAMRKAALPKDSVVPIYRQLVDLGKEIVEKGDVK